LYLNRRIPASYSEFVNEANIQVDALIGKIEICKNK
jgi:hypothetical protein